MSFPYTHPSMPGTPADFPTAVTASPKGPAPWHDTCDSPVRNYAGDVILTQTQSSESPQ